MLKPIRDEGRLDTSLLCLNVLEDTWTTECRYLVNDDTIVLLEGAFLFRPDIAHFLDLIIYLQIDESTVMERAIERDVPIHGDEVVKWHEAR